MKYNRLTRRHVLQGLGISLALPLLPSLSARADGGAALPKFLVSQWYPHGGISVENTYPIYGTSSALTSSTMFAATGAEPAHHLSSAKLVDLKRTHAQVSAQRLQVLPDYDNGAARVSPLIGSFVSDAVLQQLNVLLGVDLMHYCGHTRGYLGNFSNRDGIPTGLADVPIPTIDAVIANSTNFYSAAERASQKAPAIGVFGGELLSSVVSGSGVATNPFHANSIGDLFQLLFQGVSSTPGTVDPRVAVVDRVYADYHRVVSASSAPGRRISLEDKARLTEYMDNVKGISDRMRAIAASSCDLPPTPTAAQKAQQLRNPDYQWGAGTPTTAAGQASLQRSTLELANMLLVHAFQCGTTRIAIQKLPGLHVKWDPNYFNDASTSGASDTHQQLFHRHAEVARQQYLMETQRFLFQYAYVDLIERMRTTQVVPGVSMLDQSLVYWAAECGPVTHQGMALPAILAGKAGGFFKTGNYVDYRNFERPVSRGPQAFNFGVPQNRLLGTICQAMGLAPAEYELSDAVYGTKFPGRGGKVPGYGDPGFGIAGLNKTPFPQAELNAMSDALPVVT